MIPQYELASEVNKWLRTPQAEACRLFVFEEPVFCDEPLRIPNKIHGRFMFSDLLGQLHIFSGNTDVHVSGRISNPNKHVPTVFMDKCRECTVDMDIDGGQIGVMLKGCSKCVVTGFITMEGDTATGQGYGVQFTDCIDCLALDIQADGTRYVVSYAGGFGDGNVARDITGRTVGGCAHVDVHQGDHTNLRVVDVPTFKSFNEFHPTQAEFVTERVGYVAQTVADLPGLMEFLAQAEQEAK